MICNLEPMFPAVAHIVADLDELEAEEAARMSWSTQAPAASASVMTMPDFRFLPLNSGYVAGVSSPGT